MNNIEKAIATISNGKATNKKEALTYLISCSDPGNIIQNRAAEICLENFGNKIFIRGLIEFTNFCANNCNYCGLRRDNCNVERYRLDKSVILDACAYGYEAGFRTFVLQGGEDAFFNDERMCDIVSSIKAQYPDCAVTLSIGERDRESYRALKEAGADRYLLRHETYCKEHYEMLHPAEMRWENRIRCLTDLKELGYQVGTGFMVGSPGQTEEYLAKDLLFLDDFQPEMVGIGPYLPQKDTPYASCRAGSVELTLRLVSIIRILLPNALIPATTALATASGDGRTQGLLAGANVIMPNLTPQGERTKYAIYDNKAQSGAESGEGLELLKEQLKTIGREIVIDRGDAQGFTFTR